MQAEGYPSFREFDYCAGGYGFPLAVDEYVLVFVADIDIDDSLGALEIGVPVHG